MKAKITLPNIKGYLQAHYRQVLDEMGFLEDFIKEVALFRLWLVKEISPECYNNNKCSHCGCELSSKIFEDRACSANLCYGEMPTKQEWEEFKRINPLFEKFIKSNWNKTSIKSMLTSGPIIIRDFGGEETLADLMQNNPNLTKEELLYWCPEFKEDLPGEDGTQFKIKLSKDQFSGNMTPEQIEDIARDLGFYDSGNTKPVTDNKE